MVESWTHCARSLAQNVLVSREDLEPYTHDEVAGLRTAPAVVVKATCTDQVSSIMKLAQAERTPVTPHGAGTGLSGGAVPVCGGIVLSLEKMNRVLEIDKESLMVSWTYRFNISPDSG